MVWISRNLSTIMGWKTRILSNAGRTWIEGIELLKLPKAKAALKYEQTSTKWSET
jgi:hypothetical protein